jgi:hypothetical protein
LNTVVKKALGPNGKNPAVLADLQRYATVTQASERFRGIPFPGTFMLDRGGRVTARFFEDYYWECNTVSNIMLKVGAARTPVTPLHASSEHLALEAYPSDPSASPGTRFSLVFDVTLRRGMHVYAPGASRYTVITLNIVAPRYVRIMPTRYPPSDLRLQTPERARAGLSEAVYACCGRGARSDGRSEEVACRHERARAQRHTRVPGVRRPHLLQSRLAAAVVEGLVSRERSRWSAISAAEPMKSRPPSMRDG